MKEHVGYSSMGPAVVESEARGAMDHRAWLRDLLKQAVAAVVDNAPDGEYAAIVGYLAGCADLTFADVERMMIASRSGSRQA